MTQPKFGFYYAQITWAVVYALLACLAFAILPVWLMILIDYLLSLLLLIVSVKISRDAGMLVIQGLMVVFLTLIIIAIAIAIIL